MDGLCGFGLVGVVVGGGESEFELFVVCVDELVVVECVFGFGEGGECCIFVLCD